MIKKNIDDFLLSCEKKQDNIITNINGYPFTLELVDVLGVVEDRNLIKGCIKVSHMGKIKEIYFSLSKYTPYDKVIELLNMSIIQTYLSK